MLWVEKVVSQNIFIDFFAELEHSRRSYFIEIFWVLVGFPEISMKVCKNASMQVFWVQTFLTQILPGPNFFKPSVPGGLRIFRAFASLFKQQGLSKSKTGVLSCCKWKDCSELQWSPTFWVLTCLISKDYCNESYKSNKKQARKSSEDAQAAGYAQFEKVWAG